MRIDEGRAMNDPLSLPPGAAAGGARRELRFAAASHGSLASNAQHQFAARHALAIYPKNAIYTYIPKCGCSTMRYTLAVANGCIADASDADWIHENNETFRASLQQLLSWFALNGEAWLEGLLGPEAPSGA